MMQGFDLSKITGITADSRQVKDGNLFAALPGESVNGVDFIPQAIENGACIVLAPTGTELPSETEHGNVTLITDPKPKKRFSLIASEYFSKQPAHICAVTGTSGKTSTVYFTQQLWSALDHNAASLGTLGVHSDARHDYGSLTTPDPVSLYKTLRNLSEDGITHLAMEASSHGLDQFRLEGVQIESAGFTSFSRDHLDYHKNENDYLNAKTRLFSELLPQDGYAILNADIQEYTTIRDTVKATRILTYGFHALSSDIKILSLTPHHKGQSLELRVLNKDYRIEFPLIGDFQVYNALCALGFVIAHQQDNEGYISKAVQALSHLKPVPGRLQTISGHPKAVQIIVDYAHKPGALEQVLKTLRPITKGRLICVFGCGGDRDQGKRAEMGAISEAMADITIVTDDNPRGENPADIRTMILNAAPTAQEIENRRAAIQSAVEMLEDGDVLVIAGKGHETGQIFASHTEEFNDALEVSKAIEKNITC